MLAVLTFSPAFKRENVTGSLNTINCLQTLLSAVKILHVIDCDTVHASLKQRKQEVLFV